jgi:hypothetical protein
MIKQNCETCKHEGLTENQSPCNFCLAHVENISWQPKDRQTNKNENNDWVDPDF